MAIKLTKRVIDALPVRPARYDVYDTEIPGFAVRVTPDGVKSFSLLYRAGTGRSAPKRRMTFGRYGALTVEQARKLAKETVADVARGADPAVARSASKDAPTLSVLGVDFLADVEDRRKPTTSSEYARLWKKHVVPAFGTHRVAAVTAADVARLHRSMRKTPYQANRVLALLGSFFTYAERQGVRATHTNPAHDVRPYKEASKERFLTQAEVMRLGEALTRAERTGIPPAPKRRREPKTGPSAKHRPKSADTPKKANPFAVAAIRFLLLTGWREKEALTLRWTELNTKNGTATLPNTKTDKSVRTIGAPAWLLLADLPRLSGSPFVFPGRTPDKPLIEINRTWDAVRIAAKLDDVRLHDLRHSFASVNASNGGSLLMIGKLLGHRDSATTAKYAHLFDDAVRSAADSTSTTISAWLAGKQDEPLAIRPVAHGAETEHLALVPANRRTHAS
jgi:integrase